MDRRPQLDLDVRVGTTHSSRGLSAGNLAAMSNPAVGAAAAPSARQQRRRRH